MIPGDPGPGAVLDVLLAVVLVAYAVSGLRQGLVVAALSLGGFLAGAVLGMAVVPGLLESWEPGVARTALVLAGVLVLAWLLQLCGALLGRRVRSRVRSAPARTADTVLGGLASLAAVAVVVWLVAGALRAGPAPDVSRAVASSRVVAAIDAAVPNHTGRLFADFHRVVEGHGFPRVFAGVTPEQILPVDAPDAAVAGPVASAAAPGVVRVLGVADDCSRGQEGSGWVVAQDRVVTNAHVVAGVDRPHVQLTGGGELLAGEVVVFDPARDLAVVAVPDLPAAPLPLGGDLDRGDDAVVVGFPLNGPYAAAPARVRDVVRAGGEDIYGRQGVVREVYSLYAAVEPGNSGGPLLDASGSVVGVVFARSLDDPSTGYALTVAESAPVLEAAAGARRAVDTGTCTLS